MTTCIKCGSYAFNLKRDGIDQGGFCDVHYWQGMASRLTAERDVFKEACASGWGEPTLVNQLRAERDALKSTCERAKGCIAGLLKCTPVRDVTETLAEIDAAIAKDVSK